MNQAMVEKFRAAIERRKDIIVEAERTLWAHPETGFNEWETSRYLEEKMERLGYALVRAGNIRLLYGF